MSPNFTRLSFYSFFLITILFMGFFRNIFSKVNTSEPGGSTTSNADKGEWDFYFTNVDNKFSSIMLNLSLHKLAPKKEQPNLIWVSIKMNQPKQDGLSSNEESKNLFIIEDLLTTTIGSKFNSTFVGRLTSDGHRDFYFYVTDTTNYEQVISAAMSTKSDYKFISGAQKDKDWKIYFDFLYPLPQQRQSMENRKVIENLVKEGDKLTKPREVDHWIFFKNPEDRERFLEKIKSEGFTIVDKDKIKKGGDMPFSLHIKRVDKVDYQSVDNYIIHLWKVAQDCQGDYDGWETSVEKD
jgi:uncharacterized protein (TIGR01619 family)